MFASGSLIPIYAANSPNACSKWFWLPSRHFNPTDFELLKGCPHDAVYHRMTVIGDHPETKLFSKAQYRMIRNHTIDSTWQLFELKFNVNKVATRLYLYRNCQDTESTAKFSHHIVVLMAGKAKGNDAEQDYSQAERIMRRFLNSANN